MVTMETMALSGCSPLGSVTTRSSPKSQKSCLRGGGRGSQDLWGGSIGRSI